MATAGEKFMKSLKLREWAEIERRTGEGMGSLMQAGAPQAILTACMLTIAKRRSTAHFKFEDAEEMGLEEAGEALTEAVAALGYEDDPEDADEDFTEASESLKTND